ncbi:MAG: hypothetical protein CM15mP18_2810 [Methanobacteriota archaeon]|nr:MAG: hypothetical protein CM15mP18_2810 [Euryarchaeota archaeon]
MRIQLVAHAAAGTRGSGGGGGPTGDAPVRLFELDGTPCDTMIVALDGGLSHVAPEIVPRLVVSGVNLGPNLSQDAYHSGRWGCA